jgi:formylglycine-generating enzyme required for sulfatase activity
MAGNVSEWTSTWSAHPEIFGLEAPIFRGGSYNYDEGSMPDLTVRKTVMDPQFSENPASFSAPDLGFRTASDTDPGLGG